jgi:hypothetical protein
VQALGAIGDFRLANDRVVAIIEGLDHPHYLAPSGGSLIDLTTVGGPDTMPHMFQATGLLPGDAVFYEDAQVLEGDGFAALQLRGHLDGRPSMRVSTRYEVRPCEPGIRVRTEIINNGAEAQTWIAADGFYWGGRRNLPFVPGPGRGWHHTSFGLSDHQRGVRGGAVHAGGDPHRAERDVRAYRLQRAVDDGLSQQLGDGGRDDAADRDAPRLCGVRAVHRGRRDVVGRQRGRRGARGAPAIVR